MENILIYDEDYKTIEELEEKHNTTTAEIIETLLNIIRDENIDLDEYF